MTVFNEGLESVFERIGIVSRTETVIGKPVVVGELKLVPVVEVGLGLVSPGKNEFQNASFGLVGVGATLRPVCILVVRGDEVTAISLYDSTNS